MNEEQEKLKQYLLRASPESDAEEFDLRLIESEEFAADLSFAESELVEDFLEGNLSGDELKLFNANFLVSARSQELLSETAALKKEAVRRRRSLNAAPEMPHSAFVSLFRPLLGFAAVAVIVLIAVIIWQAPWAVRTTPLEAEYAELNERDLSDLDSLRGNTTISLLSGTLRSLDGPISRHAGDLTDVVLFRLAVPSGEADDETRPVRLFKGSTLMLELGRSRIYQNQSGREVRLLLPKSALTRGQYQIRVDGPGGKPASWVFPFGIE